MLCPICKEQLYVEYIPHGFECWRHPSTKDEFCERDHLIDHIQHLEIQANLCDVYKNENHNLYEKIKDLQAKVELRNTIILDKANESNN